MWGRTSGNIYVSRWNGSSFTAPLQINPSNVFAYVSSAEGPSIEARGDTVFVTFFSTPTSASKIYSIPSYDGGITWQDTVRVDNQSSLIPYTPDVAIGPGGDPFIAFEVSTSMLTTPDHLFSRSMDGGQTFTNEISVTDSAPGEPCECCPPNIMLKDSLVYVTYRNNVNNIRNFYTAVSTDYGNTFEEIVQIDNTNWLINGCPTQPADALVTTDSLFAVWMTLINTEPRITLGALDHTTRTARSNQVVDYQMTGMLTQRNPSIGGNEDTMAVAWEDTRANSNYDCYITFSLTGTNGLGDQIVRLSDSAVSVNGNQVTPHMDYASGIYHLVYQNAFTNSVIYRTATLSATGFENTIHPSMNLAFQNPMVNSRKLQITGHDGRQLTLNVMDLNGNVVWNKKSCDGEFVLPELIPAVYFISLFSESKATSYHKLLFLGQ